MQKLGDYIREVDVRNKDLKVTNLLGVSINKSFIPSIANLIGADLSNYKIIERKHFVYVPVTSRNGEKLSIALLNDCENAIVSQAYTVFEIIDEEKLLPEYLMMWFKRPEFDRYARFHSHGSAREVFDWSEMCDVLLPIPSIEQQREIVSEYETISKRIKLNEQIIQNLEATAQTLYHKMFVEGIDKENLPEGWRIGTLGEVFEITIGRTPPRIEKKWFCGNLEKRDSVSWASIADMNNGVYILDTRERLTNEAVKRFNIPLVPPNSVLLSFKMNIGRVCITSEPTLSNEAIAHFVFKNNNQMREYLYFLLKGIDYKKIGSTSSITDSINTNMVRQIQMLLPPNDILLSFHKQVKYVFYEMFLKQKENIKLTELQSLLLAKMGR